MFTRLARVFHLTSGNNDEDSSSSEEEYDGTCVDMGSAYIRPSKKTQEIEGVVTNMYSTYGLINSEIVFTRDSFIGSEMPLVGDKVNVRAYKEHSSAGWLAENVTKVENCWDDSPEWSSDDDFKKVKGELEDRKLEEEGKKKIRKERRIADREALEQLLKEKFGVEISGADFSKMEIGDKKSILLEIKNNGTESQSLCRYKMNNKSQQIDLGPLRMSAIDTKSESKKYQEMLPIDILPGQSVSLTIMCLAKYIGTETQTVVFSFEKFKIGKVISVSVSDPSIKLVGMGPESSYQKIDKLERVMMTRQQASNRDSVLVPGPKLQFNKGKQKSKGPIIRLPHYHVPDDLRDCVITGKDITRILPCLKRSLNSSTYEIRFSGLLHLEEIQQEIDIREFDMDKATMERAGEYLSLKVPGLLEGRPSLILGDRVIASEVEMFNTAAPAYEGVVHQVRSDSVYLMFSPEFHKTFVPEVQFNMSFTFNRSTLRRCHMAIELASKFKDEILFPTKIILKPSQVDLLNSSSASVSSTNHRAAVVPVSAAIGRKHSSYYPNIRTDQSVKFFNGQLNTRQRLAVIRILQGQARPTPYIIFGPPGTGKTITVVESILQLQHHLPHARILACTPSNSAADLLAERLFQSGVVHKSMVVRLYAALRQDISIPDSVKSFSCFVDDPDLNLEDKSIVICTCATAGSLYRVGKKSGRNNRINNNNNKNFGDKGNNNNNRDDSYNGGGVSFTHVFIDEAGQATEPESMIAVGLVVSTYGQIILAGDPQQLGPVLRSNLAKDYGLNVSYMERLCNLPLYTRNDEKFSNRGGYDPLLITKLLDNYRSHPALMYLPSHMFYHGELVIKAEKQLMNCLCSWSMLPNKDNFPILFHGVRGEDMREGNSPSWFNPHEVALTLKYLASILDDDVYTISPDDVGVITPYKKQVEKIKQTSALYNLPKVKVGSVEEFQGQERLVIIISTVRSSESLLDLDLKYTLGFLGNQKRFNVAITRAHSLLVVIGNPHVLCQDLCWSRLIRYCVNNGAYIGCDLPQFSQDDDPFFRNPDAPHTAPHLYSPEVNVADVVADVVARRDDGEVVAVADGGGGRCDAGGIGDGRGKVFQGREEEEVFKDSKLLDKFLVMKGSEEDDDDGIVMVGMGGTCEEGLAGGRDGGGDVKNTSNSGNNLIKRNSKNKNVNEVSNNDHNDINNNHDDDKIDINTSDNDITKRMTNTVITNPKHSSPFTLPTATPSLSENDDINNHDSDNIGNVGATNDTPTSVDSIEKLRDYSTPRSELSEISMSSVKDLLNKGMLDVSSNDSMERNDELCKKLVKQVDYYFSDVNLMRDQFLQGEIKSNPGGWVDISVLLTFNRMKMLNVNVRFVANILRQHSTIVQVSEDGLKVRRNPRLCIEQDMDKWKLTLFSRSVVLTNYPISEKIDVMQMTFETYGTITHIERGIPLKLVSGFKKRYNMMRGDLIIFDDGESARSLFKRSLDRIKKMGLSVYYLDDTIKACIEYFVSYRIEKKPRQSVECVTVEENSSSKTRQQYYLEAQKNRPYDKRLDVTNNQNRLNRRNFNCGAEESQDQRHQQQYRQQQSMEHHHHHHRHHHHRLQCNETPLNKFQQQAGCNSQQRQSYEDEKRTSKLTAHLHHKHVPGDNSTSPFCTGGEGISPINNTSSTTTPPWFKNDSASSSAETKKLASTFGSTSFSPTKNVAPTSTSITSVFFNPEKSVTVPDYHGNHGNLSEDDNEDDAIIVDNDGDDEGEEEEEEDDVGGDHGDDRDNDGDHGDKIAGHILQTITPLSPQTIIGINDEDDDDDVILISETYENDDEEEEDDYLKYKENDDDDIKGNPNFENWT